MTTNRRKFLKTTLMAGAFTTDFAIAPKRKDSYSMKEQVSGSPASDSYKLSIFSKHLQWLNYSDMAQVVGELGFDGVDLTVRPKGHVLPELVTDDLPKAVNEIRKRGLDVFMITTAIKDAKDPHTEDILRAASKLGIRHYRLGSYEYDDKRSIEANLDAIESQLKSIAALNAKYGIQGEYQNHSGTHFGAPVWDLHAVLKRINSQWLGVQYDIMHATVEGANAWSIALKLIAPFIKSIDIKDFEWAQQDGKWMSKIVPLGKGLVDFKGYFSLLKQNNIRVPVSVHYEYPLGGSEHGETSLTMKKDEVLSAMKSDCVKMREMLREAGLS